MGCGLGSNHKTPNQLKLSEAQKRSCSTLEALLPEQGIQLKTPGVKTRTLTQ